MKKKNELKKMIKEWERLMRTYPEDVNLMEACKERIAEALKELGE